ncbi:MAG: YihY/virulence factor BrkB family protein [Acidobacteriaceae bacterium]
MAALLKTSGSSWRDLFRALVHQTMSDDLVDRAGALSFWFLLGFFPMLFAVIGMLSRAGFGSMWQASLMRYVGHALPSSASTLVKQVLTQTAGNRTAWYWLAFALWSVSSATSGLIDSLNVMYGLEESRAWWRAKLLSLVLAIGVVLLVAAALVAGVFSTVGLQKLASGPAIFGTIHIAEWIAAIFVLLFALLCLYRFAPDVRDQRWKWLLPGSVIAAIVWIVASMLFKLYVDRFGNYGRLYGTLGTLVILMFWFYISGIAILIGGEINAIVEDEAAKRRLQGAKRRGQRSWREDHTAAPIIGDSK